MVAIFHDVPMDCVNQAVVAYAVPASLVMAIIYVEGGRNGTKSPNSNGTFDYGVMQINSAWLPEIMDKFGYSATELQYDACKNVMAGSWILRQNLNQLHNKPLMYAVGSYHSRTPNLNYIYSIKVLSAYQTIHKMFDQQDNPCYGSGQIC
jgi:resuscitation-promoting factor RpfA